MILFTNWIDFLWIPFALLFLRKEQKIKAVLFILSCMLILRLQVEFMTDAGFPTGFLSLLDVPVLYRGYVVYGVFIGFFLSLAHISKERNSFIYMAAAISVFVMAFVVSTGVMFL